MSCVKQILRPVLTSNPLRREDDVIFHTRDNHEIRFRVMFRNPRGVPRQCAASGRLFRCRPDAARRAQVMQV